MSDTQSGVIPFSVDRLLSTSPEDTEQVCPFCESGGFTGVDEHMAGVQYFSGDHYDSYDSEINSYTYVVCADCQNLVWYDPDFYRPDEEIDKLLGSIVECPEWLADTLNAMRLSHIIRGHN